MFPQGHSCVLHGCTIRKGSLIGMGAIILNDAEIGENAWLAPFLLFLKEKNSRLIL
jgi:carbonic anhydrase/acetyltransferase-like protein (isoleucine patch superfamily)